VFNAYEKEQSNKTKLTSLFDGLATHLEGKLQASEYSTCSRKEAYAARKSQENGCVGFISS